MILWIARVDKDNWGSQGIHLGGGGGWLSFFLQPIQFSSLSPFLSLFTKDKNLIVSAPSFWKEDPPPFFFLFFREGATETQQMAGLASVLVLGGYWIKRSLFNVT